MSALAQVKSVKHTSKCVFFRVVGIVFTIFDFGKDDFTLHMKVYSDYAICQS